MSDPIDKASVLDVFAELYDVFDDNKEICKELSKVCGRLKSLPSAEPERQSRGYEYHYDHTDCIYYISGEKVKCPVTCSQYRDGWNDAMRYIFKGGEGYKPYKRGSGDGG